MSMLYDHLNCYTKRTELILTSLSFLYLIVLFYQSTAPPSSVAVSPDRQRERAWESLCCRMWRQLQPHGALRCPVRNSSLRKKDYNIFTLLIFLRNGITESEVFTDSFSLVLRAFSEWRKMGAKFIFFWDSIISKCCQCCRFHFPKQVFM